MTEKRRLNVYGHCRHYDPQPGMVWNCLRGVDIRKHVGGPNFGWLARIPCVRSSLSAPEYIPCELREFPTAAEVKADQEEADRIVAALLSGTCSQCGAKMVTVADNADVNVTRCPNCPDVWTQGCKRVGAEFADEDAEELCL